MSGTGERERVRLATRRWRATPSGGDRDRRQRLAYTRAQARVREAHRDEFDRYLAEERAAEGLG